MQSKLRNSLASTKGFTLVELLIVVAIIGVLASQGVPAYKRMIQKSRKGEAQMLLGNIATAESAFFSEYGQYSNHIARLGAMAEGTNFVYAAGFPTGVCGVVPVQPTPGVGANQLPNLPVNFAQPVPGPAGLGAAAVLTTMIGKVNGNVPLPLARQVCGVNAVAGAAGAGNAFAVPGIVFGAAAVPASFVASATGNIRDTTGPQALQCPPGGGCDEWRINQDRTLRNTNDGVAN